MKKTLFLSILLSLLCTSFHYSVNAYTEYTAIPTSSSVVVNGELISFCSYNINGYNYFKLRDIAMALTDTEKEFEISFYANQSTNVVSVTISTKKYYPDIQYTPAGGELTSTASEEKQAILSTDSILYS